MGWGAALLEKGRIDEAIASCRKAVAINPRLIEAHANLAEVLRAGLRRKPGDAAAHFELGIECAQLGRWDEAAATLDRGLELEATDDYRWTQAAALHLGAGDVKGYRRACRELLRRFSDTQDPLIAARDAYVCLVPRDALDAADSGRAQQLAERAVAGTGEHRFHVYLVMVKGLADYRARRFRDAVQRMGQFPHETLGPHCDAVRFAVLAMAHHHLEHADDAAAALAKAKAILAKLPEPAKGLPFGDGNWHDWLYARLLGREAEDLLKKNSDRK